MTIALTQDLLGRPHFLLELLLDPERAAELVYHVLVGRRDTAAHRLVA